MIPLFRSSVTPAVLPRLGEIFQSGRLASGKETMSFEREFSEYIGNERVVACAEESSALQIALLQAGVRPGDRVVASPVSCVAATMPVLNLFATVSWCDVHADTGNMRADDLAAAARGGAKALIVTHWGGEVADIEAIRSIAAGMGMAVIEDAGEALGAEHRGVKLGATGSFATVFSFYPNRHLSCGEGAAIAYGEESAWEEGRWLRRYGIHQPSFRDELGEINPDSDIPVAGLNSSLNNISAAIGRDQLKALRERVARHRENGEYLEKALLGIPGIQNVRRLPETRSAFWVFTALAERRDDLLKALRNRGVHASRLHLRNDRYSAFAAAEKRSLPGVDGFMEKEIVLPCGWWVTDEDREKIVAAVKAGW